MHSELRGKQHPKKGFVIVSAPCRALACANPEPWRTDAGAAAQPGLHGETPELHTDPGTGGHRKRLHSKP